MGKCTLSTNNEYLAVCVSFLAPWPSTPKTPKIRDWADPRAH